MGEAPKTAFDYDRFKDSDTSSLCSNTTGTFSAQSLVSASPAVKFGNIHPPSGQLPLDVSALFMRDGSPPKNMRFNKAIFGLGITQILLGVLLMIFNILAIVSSATPLRYMVVGVEASGIWGGIITAIAGLLAILASRQASNCRVVACLVMAIIAAIAAGIGVIFNGIWMPGAERYAHTDYYYNHGRNGVDNRTAGPLVGCAMGMILSLVNVVVSIVVASFMCANSACCSGGGFGNGKTVYIAVPMENLGEIITKNAGGNTKVVVMPFNNKA